MFKRQIFLTLAVLLLGLCTAGCTVVREYPEAEKVAEPKKAEHEIARQLLHAFVANDASKFVSLLPEETQQKFTKESFKQYRKKITESVGEPVSFTFLTALELQALTPQIWKVRFRRTDDKRGTEFTSEVLFRVITGMSGKKSAVITSFQFI